MSWLDGLRDRLHWLFRSSDSEERLDSEIRFHLEMETAKHVDAGSRMYGNVDGDLLYAYDMKAVGQELQPHLWARLKRA